ncbi:MAG TPA: AI-2E family transporter YdiK [Candidatus Binatia bacterium]|nr:AI-2E family transporter YdiK [Candidatus Binatia bacterium]
MEASRSPDLTRTTFQLLALGILIAAAFWILQPFLIAVTWATMIVIATWPLLLSAQAWLGGRRSLAVLVMTLALLLILVVPLYFGVTAIVGNAKRIVEWSQALTTFRLPALPGWIEALPLVGPRIASRWQQLAALPPDELSARLAPYAQKLVLWFAGQVGGIGKLFVQFLLTVIVAAILYANGETAARGVDRFARRLAGQRGENAVHLAGMAIRGVALGVVVTATLQTMATGVGLFIVGVPLVTILTAVAFILAIAQIGPAIMLIPIVFWVYSTKGGAWGTGFLVWAIFCCTFDNLLRPVLIKRGADLPLLLVFSGVIGGLIAFGVIGLFIGPVVLAVGYTLLVDWVAAGAAGEQPAPPKA